MALLLMCSLGMLASCNRMITPRETQLSKEADAKAAEASYAEAINLYEAALDGSARSADVHYKLALIYDDKMNDPLNALHHFKRFLTLEPTGKRAEEVKGFMKRDELTLLTNLTGDSMVPRSELVRLNNENLNLRQQIGERWAEQKAASGAGKAAARPAKGQPNEKVKRSGKERSYTVQRGDTLASISRKFYKSSARWQRILDANADLLSKPADLKPGQTLVIP
ncbi:MAG: LysM peptidoglycan-binding domain-containing protein [Chthoniobacterales bacterium]|nr:LysM peptidoglycan-binding domain-containing protein [Chthoniobacterales bacterium]